jgi:putative flavoprotein involved in K+ transport
MGAAVRDRVDVAIIGAGQAGLATSWYLSRAGVGHVILESGRVGETWRTRRWDSFCLVTPNWSVKLPGAEYDGPDPDGYMRLADIVKHFDAWAASFKAPVFEHTPVSRLEQDGTEFVLSLPDHELRARQVIVATGAYQAAFRPDGADSIPAGVTQLFAEEYSNPNALPPGAVLIVGSGQTGCQLTEELHVAGRTVFLSCGRSAWMPRRLEGRDIVWWAIESGFWDRTPDQLPSPIARLLSNPQLTGHGGGHDLNYRTVHAMGVELVGRFSGADGSKICFADDLAASVDFGDARWADFRKMIDDCCVRGGMPIPEYEIPAPLRTNTRTELDVVGERIGSVIWTSGYRPNYGWVKVPVFDDMGFPIQVDGRSQVAGLFFIGVHWMRKNQSTVLYGIGEDAEIVARQVVEARA